MNNRRSYIFIFVGAVIGGLAALVIPGLSVGAGIPIGVAMGIAAATDWGGQSGDCGSLRSKRRRSGGHS